MSPGCRDRPQMGERLVRVAAQQLEAVALGLGERLLVGKDGGGRAVVEPEGAEDPVGGVPIHVGHPVRIEDGSRISPEDPVVGPDGQLGRSALVAVLPGPVVGLGQLDPDRVRTVARGEACPLLGPDHVVGRGQDRREVDPDGVVPETGEGFEAGHGH